MRALVVSLVLSGLLTSTTGIAGADHIRAVTKQAVTPAVPPATSVAPTDDPDQRVRCRSIQATGSLVRRERVCRTVAEWRRIAQAGNDRARDVVGTGTICSGGECGNGN